MMGGEQAAGKWQIKMLGEFVVRKPDGTTVPVSNKRPDALLAALAYYEGGQAGRIRFSEQFEQEIKRDNRKKPLTNSQRVSLVLHDDILHANWVSVQYNLLETMAKAVLLQGRGNYGLQSETFTSDVDMFESEITAARLSAEDLDEQADHLLNAVQLYQGPFLDRFPVEVETWIGRPRALLQEAYVEALNLLADRIRTVDVNLARYCETHAAKGHPLEEQALTRIERCLRKRGNPSVLTIMTPEPPVGPTAGEIRSAKGEPRPVLLSPGRNLDPPESPNNLPRQATSFVGREREMEEVKTLLNKTRLLTLTGSGGCGKTRLGLQVAYGVLGNYPDGVWLIELASLADPTHVTQAVASILGRTEEAGRPLLQTLMDFLKTKRLLLLLDNCEHVLDACAHLADALLRNCPQVQLLASSREALGIGGEQTYTVPSLSVPDACPVQTAESVSRYDAPRLFIARASAVDSQFTLTNADAPALAQLCLRLDGIPFAIELAAARVRSLSVEEINSRLCSRFRLLTGGSRTALPRQQTLRALIDWSYDLLNAPEKTLLSCLSVFAGGWTLEAAEAVGTGAGAEEGDILDLLASLVDKNLVVPEPGQGQTRYRLLETVREYARERLEESGVSERVQSRHQEFFAAFAVAAEPQILGPEQAAWLDRLEREHDNLRVALEFNNKEVALRMAGALWRFWEVRGYLSEGREHLASVLAGDAVPRRTMAWAKALRGAGALAHSQGDYTTAQTLHQDCLALYQELGDRQGIAYALTSLGTIAQHRGDNAAAKNLYEQSLALERELDDRRGIAYSLNCLADVAQNLGDYSSAQTLYKQSVVLLRELGDKRGAAYSLLGLGDVAREQGDSAAARVLYEESLALERELRNKRGIAWSLLGLGAVAYEQGDYASARKLYEESLTLRRELGDRQGAAWLLEAFASLAYVQKQSARAVKLWGAAEALREAIGAPLSPSYERTRYDRQVAQSRSAMGEAAFAAAWSEGRAMTLEQAIDFALQGDASSMARIKNQK